MNELEKARAAAKILAQHKYGGSQKWRVRRIQGEEEVYGSDSNYWSEPQWDRITVSAVSGLLREFSSDDAWIIAQSLESATS